MRIIIGICIGVAVTVVVTHPPTAVVAPMKALARQDRLITNGWYERADSKAVGSGITSWNMRLGETGVRCLCGAEAFRGYDDGDGFVVTVAPKGYRDIVGRRFKTKAVNCLNCAD